MTNLFTTKTNFSAGALSPDLLGRVDLKSYDNGALVLENVFIQPTGGVYRRFGTRYLADFATSGRLIAYTKSASESYLIVLQDQSARIYRDGVLQTTLATPWSASQIASVCWCSGGDALYFTHPDVAPQRLTGSGNSWILSAFTFLTEDQCLRQPYHRFSDDSTTLSASAVTGSITLTASSDVFLNRHIGTPFKIAAGYVQITAVESPRSATATVLKKLVKSAGDTDSLAPTRSWGEPAFSAAYGWPRTVAFYQSRLVFGGSKSLPNHLWFSQSGDLTNFELGDGYDSEGIEFSLLSDQDNTICALFAGRHLQVFTTNAEWMVSGDPLTPTNIQLKRQTQVGSPADRFVPPIGIDGATIFPAANGHEVREFLFADIEQAYQATDLSLLSSHLIATPVDQAYDKHHRQAYLVMGDGRLCVLTSFRAEDIQSWTDQTTAGAFLSVAVAGAKTYLLVRRGDRYYLEEFTPDLHTDCGFLLTAETPTTTFTGLAPLNGQTVKVLADGTPMPDMVVANGQIILPYAARRVEVGLPFTHDITPLPPAVGASNGAAPVSSARLVKAVFRLIDTCSFQVDTGTGFHQELVPTLSDYRLDTQLPAQTADIAIRSLGWRTTPTAPLWHIRGDLPQSFKLVSATTDIQIGG